ncbi:MAG: nucleotide exchange factor GrpE [bacterium]|nr:nucleotide exchange factor GrpE [bacterium]
MSEEARREGDRPDEAKTPSETGDDLRTELEAARQEARENWERFLRAVADNENYRRRVERDLAASIRRGKGEFLLGFLALKDNLELALKTPGESGSLREGLELILRQFDVLLEREGVAAIEAEGCFFDPALHEAVAVLEDPGVDTEVVAEELQRGYRHGDEVLRPARVRVARPAPPGRGPVGP